MKIYGDKFNNILIKANKIEMGSDVSFGKNINVDIRGIFTIGDRSHLGNNVKIVGNNVSFGSDLYHSDGLNIGGGGHANPTANFTMGDRCTIHNNYINLAKEIVIGDDVGLSLDVSIQTHGYWLSVLEGYPTKFAGVSINDGVIAGFRSVILMGVTIAKNIVIGACSVVTKNLTEPSGVYVGNPARFIKKVVPLSTAEKIKKVDYIIDEYKKITEHHNMSSFIEINYPVIAIDDCNFNVETSQFNGLENEYTDHFRDYIRKWGIRFYSNRPFKSIIKG